MLIQEIQNCLLSMNIITSNRSKRFRITNTTEEKTKLFASDRMVYIHLVPQLKKFKYEKLMHLYSQL